MPGNIRVGKITYQNNNPVHPSYPGFTPIVVLTKSSPYGSLGPYELKDEYGRIFENLWQFSKVYPWVPRSIQYHSRQYRLIVWDHPEEIHVDNGLLTDQYWAWRMKGMCNKYPVRYPVGNDKHKSMCLCSIKEGETEPLDYITARKRIYLPEYIRLVKQQRQFHELLERHLQGENLLVIEIDGPHQESLTSYQEQYHVNDEFIINHTILVTPHNMNIMINDPKHAFGHGYCLAMALLNLTV